MRSIDKDKEKLRQLKTEAGEIKRKIAKEESRLTEIDKIASLPQSKVPINYNKVTSMAIAYRDFVASKAYHEDNNYSHYIFEEVLEAVFGKYYFVWENKHIN